MTGAADFQRIARLNKALRIRTALTVAAVNRGDIDIFSNDYLQTISNWTDEQWAVACQCANVPTASVVTRALVLDLIRERQGKANLIFDCGIAPVVAARAEVSHGG